jgi:hypothetical protein
LRRCWQEGIEENQRGRRVPIIFSLFVEKGSKTQGHLQAPGMEEQLLAWLSRVLSQESKDTKGRRVEGSKSPRDKYCIWCRIGD